MKFEEVKKEIAYINNNLKFFSWMDFDYADIDSLQVKLIGSIDLTYKDNIYLELIFDEPLYISTLLFQFHKHDEKEFIEIASEEEYLKKHGFKLPSYFYAFKINVDGYDEAPIWITCKSIKFNILKE